MKPIIIIILTSFPS